MTNSETERSTFVGWFWPPEYITPHSLRVMKSSSTSSYGQRGCSTRVTSLCPTELHFCFTINYVLSSGTASVPSYSRSWRQKAMAYTEYGYTTVDGNFCKAQLRISNCIPLSADNWTNEEAFHAVINKVIYAISSWTVLFSRYSLQYLYSG